MRPSYTILATILAIVTIIISSDLYAQTDPRTAVWKDDNSIRIPGTMQHHPMPQTEGTPIVFSGTSAVGLQGRYQGQFGNRGLHNIIVDPDKPNNIHAAIQFANNVTEADTIPGKNFLPQLTVYYLFSSDGGKTWTTPKPIDTVKTQYPEMILFKRGSDWVPAIAAVRNYPDTNTPFFCSLYLEQGAPGAGSFAEFRTDRKTYFDSLRNLNYPSIALSKDSTKIFMTSGIDNFHEKMAYIQFGTFTLSADKKTAAWGGWKAGPSAGSLSKENSEGLAYSWSASVRVAPSGKIGVVWLNRHFLHSPDTSSTDLSTYLSESTDGGATWLASAVTVLAPLSTQQTNDQKGNPFVFVAFDHDFWYSGEHAQCALSGFYYNRDSTAGYYVPQSGSLLFWNDTMSQPMLLLSLENDTQLGQSILDGSWLSQWQNTAGGIDPQGLTNLEFPTVARTDDPKSFFIYFNAWQNADFQDMSNIGQIGTGMYISYPYFGIWRVRTFDGGVNFTDAEMIHGNDVNNADQTKYDFRQIETAPWNPKISYGTDIHTLFNVDSSAGIIDYAGNPGFDEVTWLHEKAFFSAVHETGTQMDRGITNYPNPFALTTTIDLFLDEAAAVSLRVTDLLGRTVQQIGYGFFSRGEQKLSFDGSSLAAGSYPYIVTSGSKKMQGIFTIVK